MIKWRKDSVKALKAQKERTEGLLMEAYEAIAYLYEDNLTLQEQNLVLMEAITEVYELMLGGV